MKKVSECLLGTKHKHTKPPRSGGFWVLAFGRAYKGRGGSYWNVYLWSSLRNHVCYVAC